MDLFLYFDIALFFNNFQIYFLLRISLFARPSFYTCSVVNLAGFLSPPYLQLFVIYGPVRSVKYSSIFLPLSLLF